MNTTQLRASFSTIMVGAGVLVPVLYFGIQLLSAPFYPGYDFTRQAASDLGSGGSSLPMLFNTGAILSGVAALLAAIGFRAVLARLRVHLIVVVLVTLLLVCVALCNAWAGVYPLPDPRHGANPFSVGLFLTPILLTILAWNFRDAATLRAYLVANLLVLLGLVAVRAFNLNIQSIEGLFQRALAFVVFVPIGVVSWFLMKKTART